MRHTVVYLSHREQRCGVYQFGRRIGSVLEGSREFDIRYRECASPTELQQVIETDRPSLIVYNYHPTTLSWVTAELTRQIRLPQVGTIHEVTQEVADQADRSLFDYHVAPDPTLVLKNPWVFKTGRLAAKYDHRFPLPTVPTIGSFGFGTDGKGIQSLVAVVQEQFDVAVIRLHLPYAKFGDDRGTRALAIVDACRALIDKPGISLQPTHEFLDEPQLLQFLAQNTCNAFFYNHAKGRGISSAIDYALGVGRPIAIRRTEMLRHLWEASPSICIEDRSLPEIIASGTRPIEQFCAENLLWDYERIIRKVLAAPRLDRSLTAVLAKKVRRRLRRALDSFNYRVFGKIAPPPETSSQPAGQTDWIRDTASHVDVSTRYHAVTYQPVTLGPEDRLNRILDDSARRLYRRTVSQLITWLPDLMAKKISRANVQQAFGLDTVVRLAGPPGGDAKLLCVGSFEDTTCWGLKRLGYCVEEIDPVLNYDLGEFITRPTTKAASYEVIFSISVIEHVEDDERFMKEIASLLKPDGHIVLTGGYQDSYRPGDHKPAVDWRLYTRADLRSRLLACVPECVPVDEPTWNDAKPDFRWEERDYTFASLVLQKKAIVHAVDHDHLQ